MIFKDRQEAGRKLSEKLSGQNIDIVVSIPRGGVVVGREVSLKLKIPHKAIVVKKIAHPDYPELALGAVSGKNIYWDENILYDLKIPQEEIDFSLRKAQIKQEEYQKKFGKLPNVIGKTVCLVDDGVATGSTAILAAKILKDKGAKKVLLAVPVISADTRREVSSHFDSIIALFVPGKLTSVGQFYEDFTQVTDEDIVKTG